MAILGMYRGVGRVVGVGGLLDNIEMCALMSHKLLVYHTVGMPRQI